MGCLRRGMIITILLLDVVTFGLTIAVLGSAGVLGQAALIAKDDALLLVVMNGAALVGTLVLAVVIWLGSRDRSRGDRELSRP